MLTDAAIKRLSPRESAYRESDSCGIAGFCVKVYPSGTRTFELRVKRDGVTKYYRLGEFGKTPLSAARDKARAILARLDQGLPAIEEPVAAPVTATLAMLIDAWLIHQADRGRRRLDDVRQSLETNCQGILGRSAASITSADIRAVLAAIHQRGSRVMANRVRSALHTCFQYGLQHDHDPRTLYQAVLFGLTGNPVSAVPADPGAERAGERSLSWPEVRLLWIAESETISWEARQGAKLLMCLGARVNEIIGSPWDEWDLSTGVWTLPAARSKVKRDVLTPIPAMAAALLAELRGRMPSDWLFPARNSATAVKPWGAESLGHAVRRWSFAVGISPVEARDLRRSWKTLAGEAGLSLEIRNRIQGHAMQDVGSRHYDRHSYLSEKRAALDQWCAYLSRKLSL